MARFKPEPGPCRQAVTRGEKSLAAGGPPRGGPPSGLPFDVGGPTTLEGRAPLWGAIHLVGALQGPTSTCNAKLRREQVSKKCIY